MTAVALALLVGVFALTAALLLAWRAADRAGTGEAAARIRCRVLAAERDVLAVRVTAAEDGQAAWRLEADRLRAECLLLRRMVRRLNAAQPSADEVARSWAPTSPSPWLDVARRQVGGPDA